MPKKQARALSRKENGALPHRLKSENLPGGLFYFEDELIVKGVLQARVITGAGWLLEFLKVSAGEVGYNDLSAFTHNSANPTPPRRASAARRKNNIKKRQDCLPELI
jgi:hypothetical protein